MRLLEVSSVSEVMSIIHRSFRPLEAEEIGLAAAGDRYLAKAVTAHEDVPAFDRSTVDGYAVRAAETFGAGENLPGLIRLAGEVVMGGQAPPIDPGECCYVPTGGMLPAGADAVIMIEQTEPLGELIQIYRQAAPGENVIRRGEDLREGQVILEPGRRLRAAELGLIASLGHETVCVYRRPILGLISSGNEIVPVSTAMLLPGQIRDSNRIALAFLARQAGAEVIDGGIIPDDRDLLHRALTDLTRRADMVALSGGSSMGAKDYTAELLRELSEGGLLVEGVAIQPGKPTLLARAGNKPLLGLPGHPVSALNIFSLFGGACLLRLAGAHDAPWRPAIRARLARNIPSRPGRVDVVRVALSGSPEAPVATPIFGRSGLLRTLAEADGTVWIPAEADGLAAGETVEVYLWN